MRTTRFFQGLSLTTFTMGVFKTLRGNKTSVYKLFKIKTVLKRAIKGIVFGWNMPILPEKVVKFDKNIYVKIFKIIGALSTFFILSGLGLKYFPLYFYAGIPFSLPYVIYRIVLVFFIIKQYISNLKNGKHIVKNSPLDKFQTFFKLTINFLKTIITATVGTGFTVTFMSELEGFYNFYGVDGAGNVRTGLSQMSLDSLKAHEYYSQTGYKIYNESDLIEKFSTSKYRLVYGKIEGASQYYFLNSNNEPYALIEENLQSKAEYLCNFAFR